MDQHTMQATTDHGFIRQWVEDRGGRPAHVLETADPEDPGILRIEMPGYGGRDLGELSWDEFFQKFEESKLAFIYQEETADGEKSNFNKFVRRDSVQDQL